MKHTSVGSVNYTELQRLSLGHWLLGDEHLSFKLGRKGNGEYMIPLLLLDRVEFGKLVVISIPCAV